MSAPLVTCIMPTADRRRFVPRAIHYFLRQDYEPKELIVVDDGAEAVADLMPEDPRVRYVRREPRLSVGAKRNLACEHARGDIIAHWDDDDWHAPYRLRYQVDTLRQRDADVCGLDTLLFYDERTGAAWKYTYPRGQRFWLSGSALCYTRAFWAAHRFADIDVGEDARFVWEGRPARMVALDDWRCHVGVIHGRNISPKQTSGPCWESYPVEEIRLLLGDDWPLDPPATSAPGPGAAAAPPHLGVSGERSIDMLTVARAPDLQLPEFSAFNAGLALPWMRRWELPFALFQARLTDTMAILDCTINPAGFEERLRRLYPHVVYRHWNPVQGGRFATPIGTPDGAFDRVVCVNTLEHLLAPQREALTAAMAAKLKPGGLLILTSDYYFDSAWSHPAFLQAGVMRADRQEIFNGWNRVTMSDWIDTGRRHDLHPVGEAPPAPREGDPTLYVNQPPYPHACIGGVFYKTRPPEQFPARRVLLSLLIWNTRDVSLDSLRATLREARMLRRLGHEPLLCVCDNGSTDGTAAALRAVEREIDVPYRFILNPDNRGNSIARNQMIEYMLEADADYLLFMDGDIEVVPFSSFAMLRHLETHGHRLGCIGADSSWQTPYRQRAARGHYSVDGCPLHTTNLVAWTQYGLFRRAVFADGVRFDETAPFDGAGWGFEDNDLAFQMEMKGYVNQYFSGMTYLHRSARSSVRIMREHGLDPEALYARRRQYVIDKWTPVPLISNGPLADVRRINVRL